MWRIITTTVFKKFTSNGSFVATFGKNTWNVRYPQRPTSVAVDNDGNVYAAQYFANSILKFDSSGTLLTKLGSEGSQNGQFYELGDMITDGENNLYVVDKGNHRVQKF